MSEEQKTIRVVSLEGRLSSEDRDFYQNTFKKHHLALYRFICRMGVAKDRAQDIAQDVYLRIVRQNEPAKLAQTPRAYLYRVAVNLLRDGLRRDRLHTQMIEQHSLYDDPLNLVVTPERALQEKQSVRALKSAIRNLDPEERRVLLLHRFNHMTCAEIAKELKLPQRTVERRLSTALASCRAFLWRAT